MKGKLGFEGVAEAGQHNNIGRTIANTSMATPATRGGQYYLKKLSIADISTFLKIIVIEKNRFWNYRKIIVIENVHLISSDKHCSKNKSERVFHILNEYEFVLENSAKS